MDLSLVLVTYNAREPLLRTLAAVRSSDAEVIVTDCASTDGTAEVVRHTAPGVRLCALDRNRGYAAAVNAGMALAQRRMVALLNSDVVLHVDDVAGMYSVVQRASEGITGVAQRNELGVLQLTWGQRPSWWSEWRRRRREKCFRQGWGSLPATRQAVDWVSGSCMLFARRLFDRIGPWDERYFLYFEDIDWCTRARALGVPVWFDPSVTVTHLHGYSARQLPLEATLHYRESQLHYWYTHNGAGACALLRRWLLIRYRFSGGADRRVLYERVRKWTPVTGNSSCASFM